MDWLMQFGPAYAIGAGAVVLVLFAPRAFTLVRAVTSGWSKDNVAGRLAICKVCPRVKIRHHVDDKGEEATYVYCDECKCGSHHIAELNVKLGFNNLSCPIGKWGPQTAMSVHEGHDLLIERGRKEREVDQRERQNIMAGRDRDYVGPLTGQNGPVRAGTSAPGVTQATTLTDEEAKAQRERIAVARANAAQRAHAKQPPGGGVWGDRKQETEAAPVEADHEGHILVDQERDDGGHSLDERDG